MSARLLVILNAFAAGGCILAVCVALVEGAMTLFLIGLITGLANSVMAAVISRDFVAEDDGFRRRYETILIANLGGFNFLSALNLAAEERFVTSLVAFGLSMLCLWAAGGAACLTREKP